MILFNRCVQFLMVFGLLAALDGVCQAQPLQFIFHHLSPNEGLSQGTNVFIYQDSKGFIWLSSIDGLNRFDGKKVKTYKANPTNGLFDNIVTSNFFEDDQSNLWFTTYQGIHCYHRKKDTFRYYALKDAKGKKINQNCYAFYLDKNKQFWVRTGIGGGGQLHLFDTKKIKDSILCPIDGQRNYPILNEKDQVIKVVSTYFLPKNNEEKMGAELIDLQQKLQKTTLLTNAVIRSFYQENSQLWWFGTSTGLIAFDPLQQSFRIYSDYKNQPIGTVTHVTKLRDSLLIVSSSDAGVLLFSKRQKAFIQKIPNATERQYGLRSRTIESLYIDKQENLWVSSQSKGVNYTNLRKQKFERKSLPASSQITALFQSNNQQIWCSGSADTVFRFDPDGRNYKAIRMVHPGPYPKKMEDFFQDRKGDLWGVSLNYLFKWQEKTQTFNFIDSLPGNVLYTRQLSSGRIWTSTYNGVYSFSEANGRVSFLKIKGLEQYTEVTAFHEDRERRVYLALDAVSLLVLEEKNGRYHERLRIENIGYAKSFYEQDSILWVATTTGIIKINTVDLSFDKLNEKTHQAPSENYYCVLPDASGNLWLSCNRGIIKYNPDKKFYRRYTLMDGIQDNEFNTNAFLLGAQGEIWMGGNSGLNIFHPDQIKDVPHQPIIQFTRLLVNDEPFQTPVQIEELSSIVLRYGKNTLSLDFVALEYSDPSQNTFRFKLENYDQDWVNAGTNGFARYANLPPGYYTFKVKAANSDGVWNETPKTLKIHILTPWWRTWWFYLLCISTITAIAYGIFNYRLQQALKIERIRVRISSDLHDDVGTLLSGLAMQSEILELTAPEKTKPKLQRISELSRSAMSRMRDTVWAIDARKDKLENLIDRMREHAEETLTPRDILLALEVDQLALTKNIPSQIRQALYLIYKEAITNCAKHSKGDKVSVRLQKFGTKGLEMSIHDNGVVQQKTYKTTGSGLSNMRMRAEQIGGTFQVDTTQGFLITVQIPHFS